MTGVVNEQITAAKVRIVGEGENRILPLTDALAESEEKGLDLVVFAEGEIPVCKMMEYSKYLYERKKEKAKNKQKPSVLKEISFGSQIAEHDLYIYAKKGKTILEHGDKLKVFVKYCGREVRQVAGGVDLLYKFADILEHEGLKLTYIKAPTVIGSSCMMQIECQ